MKLSYLVLFLFMLIWKAQAAITIVEKHHVGKNIIVIILGVAIIFLFSFTGTIFPILLKKKKYIRIDSVLFGSIKIFGVGIIVGVAFIHMLIPGDQLLISNNSPHFFREEHPHFCGALVIIGIVFAHLIQVLTSHILQTKVIKKKPKNNVNNTGVGSDSEKTLSITSMKEISDNKPRDATASDICCLEARDFNDEVDKREKQIVFYLVELSVAIHSILIGFAFGLTNVNKIIPLTFALLFHQFFEGMAISTIFLEAKFTRIKPYIVMIGLFTLTLPIGAFIGIIVRESFNDDDPTSIAIQGCIDIIASGILIYDSLANILSSHTNSKIWNTMSIGKKAIQMICFYCGLFTMALINTFI
ncbi:Zinc/iron permease [Anaeromyces robustus]|uniref:Zinc/iron permease n=1 Tax=Anaeromyces robustus TaxID=1754192 RepID=A0A1Y1WWF4_9FUNG|nr:Zinc/iron permease [Anaeromyces robustus]|eukprot:ORX77536.1 Zinc/iron permease [Anaeromyces robustus]